MNNQNNFSNEFVQCTSYIYFRNKLKEWMHTNETAHVNKNIEFKNRQYYLINKEWVQKWKRYIGFEEINNEMKSRGKKIIELIDYNWVQPIINKNKMNKYLEPLNNREIFFAFLTFHFEISGKQVKLIS